MPVPQNPNSAVGRRARGRKTSPEVDVSRRWVDDGEEEEPVVSLARELAPRARTTVGRPPRSDCLASKHSKGLT